MEYYRLPLYILFGILPSLTWLFYYLSKDLHPEPRKMILKIFFYGAVITIPLFFIQIGLYKILIEIQYFLFFTSSLFIINILKWFLIVAFTEEIFKYLVVRAVVLKSYEFDEPLDIMLYMVVVALGFAAAENILYLFSPLSNSNTIIRDAIIISFIRFIGATFLHTLSSGLMGYFLARSFLEAKKRLKLTVSGLSAAVLLHGLYNFSIITLDSPFNFIVPIIIIVGLAAFITYAFEKVKKLKSVCQV